MQCFLTVMIINKLKLFKQLFINGSNFIPDGLSQLSKHVTFVCTYISFKASPKKVGTERSGNLAGQAVTINTVCPVQTQQFYFLHHTISNMFQLI
jgi:hypothetical protein